MSNEATVTQGSTPAVQPAATQAPSPAAPPPTAETPATPQADAAVAAKFAMLTRKEQAAVRAAAQAKADKEAAEQARTAAKAIEDKWNGYKGNKAKALEAMKELGFTYDDLTQLHLNGGQPTPEMTTEQLNARIDAMEAQRRKEVEDAKNAELTRAQAAEQQAIDNFKAGIAQHVETEKAKYPLLSNFGQIGQVWGRIEDHYNRTCERDTAGNVIKAGQILSIPDAAKAVEDGLRAQVTKAQEILNPPQVTPPATTEAPKPAPSKLVSKPNTLTSSTTPVTTSKPQRYESDAERMARIVAKYSKKPA